MQPNIWGWNSTNCWAGAIGAAVAAGMRLALDGLAPPEMSGLAELDGVPVEISVIAAAVLGGTSGLFGALIVDLIKPTDS